MKLRLTAFVMALSMASAFVVPVVAAQAAPSKAPAAAPSINALTVPITGSCSIPNVGTGTFAGTFTVDRFVSQSGQLLARGTLAGTCTVQTATGTVTQTVNQTVTIPVTNATGTCQILDLTLGPLHLDLLGLVVDLNQVHLTITAQQGPGNLLGNLLCAVANLLNQNSVSTAAIARLLNQILAAL